VDSIVKNARKIGKYSQNFSANLAKVFLHVYQEGDEKIRTKLSKLRSTWKSVFSSDTLLSVDMALQNFLCGKQASDQPGSDTR
jgi:hypothetical protein